MAPYYEYHLERANSHFPDNGATRNDHVRACVRACVKRNGDAVKTSLACAASIARTHFHPALTPNPRIPAYRAHDAVSR